MYIKLVLRYQSTVSHARKTVTKATITGEVEMGVTPGSESSQWELSLRGQKIQRGEKALNRRKARRHTYILLIIHLLHTSRSLPLTQRPEALLRAPN